MKIYNLKGGPVFGGLTAAPTTKKGTFNELVSLTIAS
jgi:hypothetical protein